MAIIKSKNKIAKEQFRVSITKNIIDEIKQYCERFEIAKIVNTLMYKQLQDEQLGKKFASQDMKLLSTIQNILFNELAVSLETTSDDIYNRVVKCIEEQL